VGQPFWAADWYSANPGDAVAYGLTANRPRKSPKSHSAIRRTRHATLRGV